MTGHPIADTARAAAPLFVMLANIDDQLAEAHMNRAAHPAVAHRISNLEADRAGTLARIAELLPERIAL